MYKLINQSAYILRLEDAAAIPDNPTNSDYRLYLDWLNAGNTPEPADQPSLGQVKARAEAGINQRIEQAKVTAGIVVGLPGMVAQYASNAFYVERWINAGRPAEPDAEDYPTAEAERQGFTPVKTLAQMLGTWETMWAAMNAANAGIMLARRKALEAVKAAADVAEVEAALVELESDLAE